MAKNRAQQEELYRLFMAYDALLGRLYDGFIRELARLGFDIAELEEHPLFGFGSFPELRERLNEIFNGFVERNIRVLRNGIEDGVALAFAQDAKNLAGVTMLGKKALAQVRGNAVKAFLAKRLHPSGGGLSLSHRVWNYAQQAKVEFEMALSNVITDGLAKGTPAEELGRRVRQQLNDPDMMYRRYHLKVVQSDGSKKDVVKWYRRVIGQDGKVHFVRAPLEEVGTGTYRSARRNALRLMRSEINMSYHYANNERWKREPFVIGIRVWGSPEHPRPDICDELWGDYPKDFNFAGWHPQCLCASAPILCSKEELNEVIRRKQQGEDISAYVSPNAVKDVPEGFRKYMEGHHDKIIGYYERGTTPYFMRDNPKYMRRWFSEAEQKRMGLFEGVKTVPSKDIHNQRDTATHSNRASIKKAQKELVEWYKQNLPETTVGKFSAKRFEIKDMDGLDVIINRKFYDEIISKYQDDPLYTLKLEYAKKAHELFPTAGLTNPSEQERDHPDSFFRVYESVIGNNVLEWKVKCNRDVNALYYLRVYKR